MTGAVVGLVSGVLASTHRARANTLRFLLEELDRLAADATLERIEPAVHDAEFRALERARQNENGEPK